MSSPSNNCSAWIANALVDAGVTTVYGGHGGALVPLVNAIAQHPQLNWVCTRNEANASLMAAAHAKLLTTTKPSGNNLACCIATSGPGATNLTTGLMDAVKDKLPVICLTGMKPRQGMHYSEFQDLDQAKLFSGGGIVFSVTVPSPEALIPLLRDAVATAMTQQTVVHLAIPVDIQGAPCLIAVDRPFCAAHAGDRIHDDYSNGGNGTVSKDLVDSLTHRYRNILIAVGLRGVSAGKQILKLAEALNAPVITRLDAKGCIDEHHPLSFGVVGVHGKPGLEHSAALIETSDLVISFGVDDPTLLVCNTAGLQIRPMIEVESSALLVTTRFRAIHTLIGHDMGKVADAMRSGVLEKKQRPAKGATKPTKHSHGVDLHCEDTQRRRSLYAPTIWDLVHSIDFDDYENESLVGKEAEGSGNNASMSNLASTLMQQLEDLNILPATSPLEKRRSEAISAEAVHDSQESKRYVHPARVLDRLSDCVTTKDVVCIDTGDVTLWSALCLKQRGNGSRTLTSEHLGTMGYGLCAGIAALEEDYVERTIVLAGDGGFQMTLQELATFHQQNKRLNKKLIVLVFDNSLLGRVIFGFDGAQGCELDGPDFGALAAAYGGTGVRIASSSQIPAAVESAKPGLTLLHIPVDPELKADMATFRPDGSIQMMNSG